MNIILIFPQFTAIITLKKNIINNKIIEKIKIIIAIIIISQGICNLKNLTIKIKTLIITMEKIIMNCNII